MLRPDRRYVLLSILQIRCLCLYFRCFLATLLRIVDPLGHCRYQDRELGPTYRPMFQIWLASVFAGYLFHLLPWSPLCRLLIASLHFRSYFSRRKNGPFGSTPRQRLLHLQRHHLHRQERLRLSTCLPLLRCSWSLSYFFLNFEPFFFFFLADAWDLKMQALRKTGM